ncbi:unnamed protein product, partial [marine sediment metagenome]
LRKFDAINLKTMFRMVQAGMDVEHILQHINQRCRHQIFFDIIEISE